MRDQPFLKQPDKKLWTADDKLRSNLDAAVYKHAVLGLIFLKYVFDAFEIRQQQVEAQLRDPESDYTSSILRTTKPTALAAGQSANTTYRDIPGFCKSATLAGIAEHGYVLTPGRYAGAEEVEDDGISIEEKMPTLTAELADQFAQSADLEEGIRKNMKALGFELRAGGAK